MLPRDVRLEDDLRLDKIKFQKEQTDLTGQLTGLQQSVLMAKMMSKLRILPVQDALTQEEILPYLRPLLDHPRCWALYSSALLVRSRLESNAGRTVDRALAQMETVVEDMRNQVWQPSRMWLVYSCLLPPTWEVERELGKMMVQLGSVKSALDIYLRLELSQNKSARAYRSIGFHYYTHKDYTTAIPYFEKSLERSSFQPVTLLRLSYSA